MATITIPKELTRKGELVVIPRREWERVLRIVKKEGYGEFDQKLDKIFKEAKEGKVIGPFSSVKSLKNSLEK